MSSRGAVIGAPTRDDESQRLLYEHEPESIPSMPTLQSHRPLFELCNSKHFKLSAAERKRRRELKKDEEAAKQISSSLVIAASMLLFCNSMIFIMDTASNIPVSLFWTQ